MKTIKALIYLLVIAQPLFAQAPTDYKLTWGSIQKSPFPTAGLGEVIGKAKGSYFIMYAKRNLSNSFLPPKRFLAKTNEKLNIIEESDQLVFEKKNKKRKLFRVLNIKDKIFFLTTAYNKKEKLRELSYQELDLETLELGALNPLASVSVKDSKKGLVGVGIGGTMTFWGKHFHFSISNDSSKILIANNIFDKKNRNEIKVRIFDNSFGLLSENTIKLSYEDQDYRLANIKITNNGLIYGGSVIINKDNNKSNKFEIFKTNGKGIEKTYFLEIEKYIALRNFNIYFDVSGNIIISGVYNDDDNFGEIQGVFFQKLNNQLENEIGLKDINILSHLLGRDVKSEKKSFKYFAYEDCILKNDGGMIIIGTKEGYNSPMNSANSEGTYFSKSVYLISLSSSGDLEWIKEIEKEQRNRDPSLLYQLVKFHKECESIVGFRK